MADVNLNIGGDTRRLEADIRKAVSRSYSIDLKTTGSQPLGRITSQLSEFNKSLEASNARVIAFGASAGVIFGLQSAFAKLISTTIEVQKSLADINVILNVSSSEIQKFGDQLFSIARNTGQSFNEVAIAATEFSRQGLGVEETLKRTNEALILARLSGLDTAKSVEALTAAVNSFASQAVTATEIVNKFANVDAAFAVSSADLAEAISRVGSSAAQSGVNLDELISIVTSAQQTTARGGAVIGNSFKTIFTRLQRGDVVDLLDSLGVSTMDSQGQLKSTINLLEDLATIYDKLGTLQQAEVAEKVGGVFQINILKAALADLGKEYSVYDRALEISASSTDQAIQRNEELNKTYAAQINILKENVSQLSQTAGTRVIGPSFDRVVGGANDILGLVNESDGQGVGAALGKGILDGIGQILAGPGLALIGGVLIKLFKDFTVYASGSVKELLGLNNASKQQAEIQQSINSIIAQNPQLLQLMAQGTRGVNDAAQLLLQSLQQQTLELQKQDALTSKVASQLYKGGVRIRGGVPTATQTRADGYIPAFSKESRDVQRGVGGAKASDVPIGPFNINGEPTIINSGEKLVPDFGGSGETAILTRDMQKSVSMAEGYVPNFAIDRPYARAKRSDLLKKKPGNEDYDAAQAELALRGGETFDADKILGFKLPGLLVPPGGAGKGIITKQNLLGDDNNIKFDFPVASLQIQGNQKLQQEAEKMFLVDDNFITQFVDKQVLPFTHALANTIGSPPADPKTTRNIAGVKGLKGSIEGALGSIFDAALISAVGEASTEPDGGDFDVRAAGPQFGYIDKLFQGGRGVLGGASNNLGDFKKSAGPDATNSMVAKTLKEYPNKFKPKIDNTQKNKAKKTRSRATGYIPNFADALNEAVQRELDQSGLPKNQIYVSQKQALVAPENPSGLGVFNKRDEGSTSKEKRAVRNRSSGYIPNFAEPAPQDLSSTIGALSIQLLSFAGVLALTGKQTKSAGEILPQAIRFFNQDLRSSLAAELVERRRLASQLRVGNDLELQARLSLAKNLPKGSEVRQALAQEISARRSALNQLRAANNQEIQARLRAAKQINVFQKGVAIAGSKLAGRGSVLGFGVQIAAETVRNSIPETSKAGRVGGALVGAVGSAASGAALGQTFGIQGAAIGAVAGAALGLADVFKQLTSNLPELEAALDKASQQITKTQDSNSGLLQTYEAYTKALDSGDAELIKKTQAEYENALSASTQEQRDAIDGSLTLADAQLKLAEILNKQAKEVADAAVGIEIEKIGRISSSTYVGGGGVGLRAGRFISEKNQPEIDATTSLLADTINSSVKDVDIKAGLSAKLSEQLSGIQVTDASGKLIKNSQAISSVIDNLEKEMGVKLPDSLRTMLVNSVLSGASVDVLTAALDQVSTAAQDAADVVANANKPLSDMIRKLRADFIAALDAATNAISSTIDFTSGLQSTENNLINTQKAFERSFALTEQVSGPKSVAEQITGKDSMLSITFALQEALGQIELGRMEGVESTASSTGENIYGTIGEAVKKEIENLIATGPGTIDVTDPKDLEAVMKTFTDKLQGLELLAGPNGLSLDISDKISSAIESSGGTGISDEQGNAILADLRSQLTAGGLDASTIDNLSNQITNQIQAANNSLASINQNSANQVRVAEQTAKNQLTAKQIEGALKAFGGIGEFINNEPARNPFLEDEKKGLSAKTVENLLPIRDAFSNISQIVTSTPFRYNNPESLKAREAQMPDLGREYLKLIGFLRERSGGLYTPEAGSKAIKDAEKGRAISIEEELRGMREFLKTPEAKASPEAAKEVAAAIKQIESLGVNEIARIQVAQATGTMTMGDAQKIYSDSSTRNAEIIQNIVPGLQDQLSSVFVGDGSDPVAAAISQLTVIEANSLKTLSAIEVLLGRRFDEIVPESIPMDLTTTPEAATALPKTLRETLSGEDAGSAMSDELGKFTDAAASFDNTVATISESIAANATANQNFAAGLAALASSIGPGLSPAQTAGVEGEYEGVKSLGGDLSTYGNNPATVSVNVNFGQGINVNATDISAIESQLDAKFEVMKANILGTLGNPQPPRLK